MKNRALIPNERIEKIIFLIRGQKVILDSDLATLYEVETKVLIQAVKRNRERFPKDFMFQLNTGEWKILRSQIVTSNIGGRQYLPYVFTEQGIAMLSGVLRSKRAIAVNIEVMRAFVRLHYLISSHKNLARRLDDLEKKYDYRFKIIFQTIRELMIPPKDSKPTIGFKLK